MTLEYAYQDWTLAQLAKALGHKDDYQYFNKRSMNYGSLFDTRTGYIHPRDSNGRWMENFDPLAYDHGFIEGNAAQFTWFVPHDLQNLFTLMGGRDSAVSRLNRQFEISAKHRFCNEHPEKDPRFINEKKTWINYSNQPNSQSAFIFNHAGTPWLTQQWSRAVVDSASSEVSPYRGYNGDEDQGLMGALSVLMKIGLFQMTGGCEENPVYEIGSPIFDLVMIRLNPVYYKGKEFVISTVNNGPNNRFIENAELNGRSLNRYYFDHNDLVKGGKLVLTMSDCENKNWGIEE
jgi:predicted alpha-1,2-mannosidase